MGKKKEPVGDSDSLEDSLVEGLSALSLEQCQGLTVTQIKRVRVLIDEAIEKNKVKMEEMEKSRDSILGEMSNWLHPSVPVSNDEDADNRVERTWGDIEGRKKYSHFDLIHMIGGVDTERGAVTRVICVLLEMNQTETGIAVPDAIKMYMPEKYREEI